MRVVVIVFCLLASAQVEGSRIWYKSGVRKVNVLETILQRCFNYTPPPNANLRYKDCKKIEEAFKNAFVKKDPCKIEEAYYHPLRDLVNQDVPRDKVLLWSQTKDLANSYAAKEKLLTLNNMLLGYIADDLTWCADGSEVKSDPCPQWSKNCPKTAMSAFWDMASRWFAGKACGQVQVLLSGSSGAAYNKSSTFGRVEVPAMRQVGKVTSMHACVVRDPGVPASDSCSGSSIKELKSLLSKKRIAFTCKDIDGPDKILECAQKL